MDGMEQRGHRLFRGLCLIFSDGCICQNIKKLGGFLAVIGMESRKSWNLYRIIQYTETGRKSFKLYAIPGDKFNPLSFIYRKISKPGEPFLPSIEHVTMLK